MPPLLILIFLKIFWGKFSYEHPVTQILILKLDYALIPLFYETSCIKKALTVKFWHHSDALQRHAAAAYLDESRRNVGFRRNAQS